MAYNPPFTIKSKAATAGSPMRTTPSNSPALRPPARSPQKPTYQSNLSLQTIIGTTITTPNGLSVHGQSKSFALCAGSTAVLAELDDENNISQRFFRARPSATSINPVASFYNQNSTPATPEPKSRSLSVVRTNANGVGGSSYNGSPTTDWADAVNARPWSSRERVKAVTCVSVSPNGRLLAFGETGYNPRVLIFSTTKGSSPDVPLTILNEHTFGVRSLAFSTDSQYLATLGDVNDGFLFVWAVSLSNGSARLHSANKCTSFVKSVCWMGQTLITAGVRHVKVWRLPDVRPASPSKTPSNVDPNSSPANSAPKALSGRNCILGGLGSQIFTCVARISDHEAVLGTDAGAVCYLDGSDGSPKLTLVKIVEFGIASLAVDSDGESVWLGGRGVRMQRLTFEDLRNLTVSAPSSPVSTQRTPADHQTKGPAVTSMGFLSSHLVTLDSRRAIHIYATESLDEDGQQDHPEALLPAHRDAVLGIGSLKVPNDREAEFYTWSCEGTVNFWDTGGRCHDSQKIDLEQLSRADEDVTNELKIVRTTDSMDFFVSGDKFGVLRVLSGQPWESIQEVRAHGGEITDIAIHELSQGCFLVASCGRDRMVQLFRKDEVGFELIQTMEDHVGAVGQLLFLNNGEKLLSCSADRTILVRDRVIREVDGMEVLAYIISKVITLKSSPVSMTVMPDDPDTLVFSTIDRSIQLYSLETGRHIRSFRSSDQEASDAVVMNSLTVSTGIPGQSPKLLVGVSSTDKSIRVYDLEQETLLTGEFGHTEGVSALYFLESRPATPESPGKRLLISAGIDGIVIIWKLSVQLQPQSVQEPFQDNPREDDDTPSKGLIAAKAPLRRILSRSELASFQQTTSSPAFIREPSLVIRRKMSKQSLVSSSLRTGNGTSITPPPPIPAPCRPSTSTSIDRDGRSPSPLSPKTRSTRRLYSENNYRSRNSSVDVRSRTRNSGKNDPGSLTSSTEQICRTLRTYRKKLSISTERIDCAKELERELNLTLRTLTSRVKNTEEASETTETDSSGKENGRLLIPPPVPSSENKRPRTPRRAPSTPNLSRMGSRNVSRSRSVGREGSV